MLNRFFSCWPSRLRFRRALPLIGILFITPSISNAVELPLREGKPEPDEMPWQGPEGVREKVDEIMERQKGQAGARPRMELHPHNRSDPGIIRPNPNQQDTPIYP